MSWRRPRLFFQVSSFAAPTPRRESATSIWRATIPAAIRERSATVRSRIGSSCCGWAVQPTTAEFYDAIRAEAPTTRQRALIRMWAREAEPAQIVLAWAEEVYTFRELVAAFHRAEADHPLVARAFNRLARR